MLSHPKLLSIRFSIGQSIKLSSAITLLTLSSATYGTSDLDRTHALIVNAIYELPFLRGRSRLVNRAPGNWEVSGIYQYRSGSPFSVRTGADNRFTLKSAG